MILPDWNIEDAIRSGRIGVSPHEPRLIQPASLDVRLGSAFRVFRADVEVIDPYVEIPTELVEVAPGATFVLEPGTFALGETLERVSLPSALVARVEGKSSVGRLGMFVHVTAGFIDPGFDGTITLELHNVTGRPWVMTPGMTIAQLSFHEMTGEAARPYGAGATGSKYLGQTGPTPSGYWRNPRP